MGDLVGDVKPKMPCPPAASFPGRKTQMSGPLSLTSVILTGIPGSMPRTFINDPARRTGPLKLNGEWKQAPKAANSTSFVLPVLWDNNESTWHAAGRGIVANW